MRVWWVWASLCQPYVAVSKAGVLLPAGSCVSRICILHGVRSLQQVTGKGAALLHGSRRHTVMMLSMPNLSL